MYGRAHPPFRRDDLPPGEESDGEYYSSSGPERRGGRPGGPGGGDVSDSGEDDGRYHQQHQHQQQGGYGRGGEQQGGGGIRQHPHVSKKKLFRPATLPHIDRRKRGDEQEGGGGHMSREERDQRARTVGPGVVVHAFDPPLEQASVPLDDYAEDWVIRPRANSGLSKLQRRRKYDSYMDTLEVERLRKLDEQLLQRAATYEDLDDLEDDEEVVEEGKVESRQHGGRDEEAGFMRGSRRYGEVGRQDVARGDEGEADIRTREERGRQRAAAKVVNVRRARSASPKREKLCEELDGMDEDDECKNSPGTMPYGSHQSRRRDSYPLQQPHGRHSQQADTTGNPPPGNRFSSRHIPNPRHSQRYPEPMVDEDEEDEGSPYRPEDSPSHQQQGSFFGPLPRVRFYRDGVTNVAPPDDPSFHDIRRAAPTITTSSNGSSTMTLGGKPAKGHKSSADMAAAAARAGHHGLGVSWLYDIDEAPPTGAGDGKKGGGGGQEPHQKTLLEWLDRSQRMTGDAERTARAALYLHDAIDTRPPRHQSRGLMTVKAYTFAKGAWWSGLVVAAAVLHLLLALWEPPRVLPNSHPYRDSLNRHMLRHANDTYQQLLGLECFLVMIYLLDLAIEIFSLGPATFFALGPPPRVIKGMPRSAAWGNRTWSQVRFVVVLLFLFDVSGNLDGGITSHFSRCLRPLFLICVCDPLKRWAILTYKLLTQLRDVAICISIVLALFSLTGLILFSETEYYANGLRFQNFSTFFNSFVSLYVLLTTQNFTDLLDPAYTADPSRSTPLYFFYFASFVVVLVLFLANLALPRVYWVFQSFQRAQAYQARKNERLALLLSFRSLDVDQRGYIDLTQFRDMLRFLRPEFFDPQTGYEKESCQGATEHMFLELAKDHPGRIYPTNYFKICEVILMDFYPLAGTMPRQHARHEASTFLRDKVFESRWAELMSLVVLLLSLFFLSFYGSPSIDKSQLRDFSYFVIVLFTVEVLLKIYAYGPRAFFGKFENTIDAVVMGAAFFSILVYGCSKHTSYIRRSEQLANLGLLFLTFRGVRLFPKFDIFAKFQCAFKVLPFFFFSFVVSLLLMYSWAAIGMALFSGLASRPTTSDFGRLANVNNFESFWSATVTLFQVAATHNWHRTMYMWMDLSDTCWTALYFLLFHCVANVVAVQLTTALFLDAFLSFDGKRWMEGSGDDDDEDNGGNHDGGGNKGGGLNGLNDGLDGFGPATPRVVVPEAPEPPSEHDDIDDVPRVPAAEPPRSSGGAPCRGPPHQSSTTSSYPHMPQQHGTRFSANLGASSSPVGAPTSHPNHHHRLSSLGYRATVV